MPSHTDIEARKVLAERLIDDVTHSLETLSVYLGLGLGVDPTPIETIFRLKAALATGVGG